MLSASGRISSTSAHTSLSGMGTPPICIRSLKRKMYGDVYSPVL